MSVLLVLMIAVPAHAAESKVWFTPLPGKETITLAPGAPILIYAKLTNALKDPVTYVLAFTAGDKTIGTKVVTLAGYTAQDTSVEWKMPETSTVVTATIAKASDSSKKELKALAGPIGSVTVGVPDLAKELNMGPIKGWVGGIVGTLEAFRVKELVYFTDLKDEAKEVLGRTTIKDVGDFLQPETPMQSATGANPEIEQKDEGTTMGYLKLVYATIGKAFFAHRGVYFVAIIVVALLVIRLVLKLLFR